MKFKNANNYTEKLHWGFFKFYTLTSESSK